MIKPRTNKKINKQIKKIYKKKKWYLMDLAVLSRVKIKENKRLNKYLDHARELKNLWNMKVTVISIVIGALETVPRG